MMNFYLTSKNHAILDITILSSYPEDTVKNSLIALIVLLLLAGGIYAGYKYVRHNTRAPMMATQPAKTASAMLSSLQDVFTNKALSLKCEFPEENNMKTTAYIKAGAIRTDSVGDSSQSGSMIFKDNKMYIWTLNPKQGFMMTLSDQQIKDMQNNMAGTAPTGTIQSQGQSTLAMIDKFKNNCMSAVVDDSLFTPPTDIKFTDYSAMMQQMQKQTQTMPTSGQMSQEHIQQIMQQYQGQK